MYNGYKHQISNAQLAAQVDMLEETMGKRKAAKALGFAPDHNHLVTEEIDNRVKLAMWQIDNWDWVCEIEAQAQDSADLIDTQECARW